MRSGACEHSGRRLARQRAQEVHEIALKIFKGEKCPKSLEGGKQGNGEQEGRSRR